MNLTIFYSWQTTTDTKYNKNFIFSCIEKAVKKIKNKPEFLKVDFIIQEGVTNEPGSVPVASQIADTRIPNCDIFIADLTVVNHLFPKDISNDILVKLKSSIKSSPNPNVLLEYGVAYRSLGSERIIGVMNSFYGSPKANSEYLPFDLRHLRFPIEYAYSEDSSIEDKTDSSKILIDELANAIKVAGIIAIQKQKDKYRPLLVWSEWAKIISTSQKFHSNEKITEVINIIKNGIQNPKESIRLLGLSGLGKTRVLFEAFRCGTDDTSIILTSRVFYINYNHNQGLDYQTKITQLMQEEVDRVLIIDNCPKILHRNLLHFINNENNKISLITIDSNPEEIEHDKIDGVNYLIIRKEELSSIVNDILTADFSFLSKDIIEKIKEFSQGIPLMAVLIGESIKKGEKFIGKLDDKELLDKLLGSKGQDERCRTILKSCSIFNYFGIEDELGSQIEFIATNKDITSLNGDSLVIINEFHETCTHFLEREIFERKGRLIGMRPFPLAMSLAQEWLNPCTPDRLIRVITGIASLPDPDRKNLSEALAEQMKYLGYNDKAVTIIDKIVGPGSPFDNAEVLNTELGSRLFRSFVEVNPVAVSQNFYRIFSSKGKEYLLKIEAGRRNIVWVLEKLCFDKRTFSDSVKIMFSFAVAENESWSNNATGQFLHLFNIFLSGTEANLVERWKIIEWGFNQAEKEYKDLAIKAMNSGLNYGHFSRMGGPENQGSKKLYDYQPTWFEIAEYWTNILNKLKEIIITQNEHSVSASKAIAESIRSICNARLAQILIPIVKEISIFKNHDWDEGLQGLKYARKYEKRSMSESQQNQINELIEALTKKDFGTRYSTIDSLYFLDDDESYSSDKVREAIIRLADEFINDKLPWNEYFSLFYKRQQNFSYYFGKRLYELLDGKDESIEKFMFLSIDTILSIPREERFPAVLGGFIAEANNEIKAKFYNYLNSIDDLNYLLFYFISLDALGMKYFQLLFDLIDDKKCELHNFDVFEYCNALNSMKFEDLFDFSEKLFSYGNEGYSIVFDLYFDLGYNNDELKKSFSPILKKCILKLGINKQQRRQLDRYKWAQTICSILDNNNESDFAVFINDSIIHSITIDNSYHLDHDVQRIFEVLMKHHFAAIWPNLSKALMCTKEEYIKFYGLKHILGSHIGGIGRSVGVLFDGDIDTIFNWCKFNKPLAPSRLAELVPIFGENNNNYSTWNPISLRLINEFGDIEGVLSNLAANMGTYSWTGSVVPLLESKKELFSTIADHKIKAVSDWAKNYITYLDLEIKQEKNRDEECI